MAADKKLKGVTLTTPTFRVNWPHIFEPQKDLSGKLKFKIDMLYTKDDDIRSLKKAYLEAGNEMWGSKENWPEFDYPTFKKKQSKNKELPEGYDILIRATSQNPPGLVDSSAKRMLEDRANEFYSGCYARAKVTFMAYDFAGKNGINVYLQSLQKVKDGEPFGFIRSNPEEDFAPIDGGDEDIDIGLE